MRITMSMRLPKGKSKVYRLLFCLLLFAYFPPALAVEEQSDVVFSPKLQKAYFEIQKLRLPAARELIDEERVVNAENPFIAYLDSYADLHYLLIAEDRSRYKVFTQQQEKRLDQVGRLRRSRPTNDYSRPTSACILHLPSSNSAMRLAAPGRSSSPTGFWKITERNFRHLPLPSNHWASSTC